MTDIFGISKTGGRPYNQDTAAHLTFAGKAAVVVCDGLGAYAGSDIASEIAAERVLNYLKKGIIRGEDVLSPALLTKAVKSAHSSILKKKGIKGDFLEGCATIALLTYDGTGAAAVTLGDTRIYLIREGKIDYQSRDHSLAQAAVDRGEITRQGIRDHADQNKLTKVIGSGAFVPPDIRLFSGPLYEGDTFLLLSDGFWSSVTENELMVAAKSAPSSRDLILGLEEILITRLTAARDNYTAVAVRITRRLHDGEIIIEKDRQEKGV